MGTEGFLFRQLIKMADSRLIRLSRRRNEQFRVRPGPAGFAVVRYDGRFGESQGPGVNRILLHETALWIFDVVCGYLYSKRIPPVGSIRSAFVI